ncbi:xylose isomerase, partial [Pseudomonas syringae pv. tagetis]
AIRAVGGLDVYRLVHVSFHHHLACVVELLPDLTGLVHIYGVEDAQAPLSSIREGQRVLVGEADILGNASQNERLLDRG